MEMESFCNECYNCKKRFECEYKILHSNLLSAKIFRQILSVDIRGYLCNSALKCLGCGRIGLKSTGTAGAAVEKEESTQE